jgi:triacylglycerol lipase
MPANDTLTPQEASYIANNVYFTLEGWINAAPKRGAESLTTVKTAVLGSGNSGRLNTTLANTNLKSANLNSTMNANTGFGEWSATTGFGYVLAFEHHGHRHVVIATRGTRPEIGAPDLLTDLRAAMTSFGSVGPVHKGFKKTFDSLTGSLQKHSSLIQSADVVHCVGHSLGGAVATLVAATMRSQGKTTKLYTFGSPRVGAFGAHLAIETAIGSSNIFRVAQDMDPITMIGPFPYVHVNARSEKSYLLRSTSPNFPSMENHDMVNYITQMGVAGARGGSQTWGQVRANAITLNRENENLANLLMGPASGEGWVQFASNRTLGILLKLFNHLLAKISTSIILQLTAVDLLAEILISGMYKIPALGEKIHQLLSWSASWAGIQAKSAADFTASVVRTILGKMLAQLNQLSQQALLNMNVGSTALPLLLTGGCAITHGCGF